MPIPKSLGPIIVKEVLENGVHAASGLFPRIAFNFLLDISFFFLLFSFFWATRGIFSSPTRDQTRDPALEAQSPNRWTTREVPITHCLLHLTFFS